MPFPQPIVPAILPGGSGTRPWPMRPIQLPLTTEIDAHALILEQRAG